MKLNDGVVKEISSSPETRKSKRIQRKLDNKHKGQCSTLAVQTQI